MTAREFLEEPGRLYNRARRLEERYNELFERATSPRCALNLGDGLGVQSSGSGNAREKLLVELADAKRKYIEAELDYIECRQNIFEVLVNIDGLAGDVMIERYIKLKTWEDVCKAERVNLSWAGVHRIHRDGLKLVEALLTEKGISEYQYTLE